MLTILHSRGWHIQLGVTLVELIVALLIFSILVAVGAPTLTTWIQGAQVRNASESILNGLQRARAEAVSRNSQAKFYLCGGSSGDSTWDVLAASAVFSASETAAVAQPCAADSASKTDWARVDSHSGTDGAPNAQVSVTQQPTTSSYNARANPITYDGLGRVTPSLTGDVWFDIDNPKGGTCILKGGTVRCMRIVVSTGGKIRMCNPALKLANNPQGCP